ncbi:ABC transporter ATP-binding protein [Leifsonia sp. H3M29-4]|uniref:ABC transporter ATP-binding protein n=1 Tax=Salinibacterium metalliresistens TaxID=3031321 RepID=UPI0023D9EA79|nr:ABC transporter ATP-binding protein [Salinibacterium metalliresistens]MDF1479397.1 ABC transporter ATP-binding protein [Salinibacterium metalliresistens]
MSRLSIEDLSVAVRATSAPILSGVSLQIEPGEIVGLVGESGSGKSMTSLATMGILPFGLEQTGGRFLVDGVDVTAERQRSVTFRFAMIFQNPRDSLNPLMRIGDQVARMVALHQGVGRAAARAEAVDLLERVHIAAAAATARKYPHQLSGGMCQRVMVAMALACRPSLLIADEPTTALDVTVQAQILDLIVELTVDTGCGVLLVTHDLGVVAQTCDRVNVLFGGELVESGSTAAVFAAPQHEYTRYLIDAGRQLEDLDGAA